MDKKILAGILAEAHGLTKSESESIVDTLFGTISSSLVKEEEVSIHGFGKFIVKHRSARQGVNPKTGEKIQIAASKGPGFKASKRLKDAIK